VKQFIQNALQKLVAHRYAKYLVLQVQRMCLRLPIQQQASRLWFGASVFGAVGVVLVLILMLGQGDEELQVSDEKVLKPTAEEIVLVEKSNEPDPFLTDQFEPADPFAVSSEPVDPFAQTEPVETVETVQASEAPESDVFNPFEPTATPAVAKVETEEPVTENPFEVNSVKSVGTPFSSGVVVQPAEPKLVGLNDAEEFIPLNDPFEEEVIPLDDPFEAEPVVAVKEDWKGFGDNRVAQLEKPATVQLPPKQITFETSEPVETEVSVPELAIQTSFEERIVRGQRTVVEIRIENVCKVELKNLELHVDLPAAIVHRFGRSLEYDIGSLKPGETRTAKLIVLINQPGQQTLKIRGLYQGTAIQAVQSNLSTAH